MPTASCNLRKDEYAKFSQLASEASETKASLLTKLVLEYISGGGGADTQQTTEESVSRLRDRLGITDGKTEPITEQLSNINNRLSNLESITGVKEPSELDRLLGTDKPVTEQLQQHTRQLTELNKKVTGFTELTEIKAKIAELGKNLDDAQGRLTTLECKETEYACLDDELAAIEEDREAHRVAGELDGAMQQYLNDMADKAKRKWGQTVTVNELENRVTQLEQQSAKNPEKIKLAATEQVNKQVVPAIERLTDKFIAQLKAIQKQLNEHQLVVDWVMKKYDLKKVKKD